MIKKARGGTGEVKLIVYMDSQEGRW